MRRRPLHSARHGAASAKRRAWRCAWRHHEAGGEQRVAIQSGGGLQQRYDSCLAAKLRCYVDWSQIHVALSLLVCSARGPAQRRVANLVLGIDVRSYSTLYTTSIYFQHRAVETWTVTCVDQLPDRVSSSVHGREMKPPPVEVTGY